MSGYVLYGKRTEAIQNTDTGEMMGPDKKFAALDSCGIRVSRLADAKIYDTKEEIEELLTKVAGKCGVVFEIRKIK